MTHRLNKRYKIEIIPVHVLTTDHDDEEIETFNEFIDEAIADEQYYHNVINEDFNAKVVMRLDENESALAISQDKIYTE